MKIKKFFKTLGSLLLFLLKATLEYSLFIVAVVAVWYDRPLSVIFCIVMAMALEYKKYVAFKINKFKKRPKDLIDRIKRARIGARNNQYPYRETGYQRDMNRERSAYEHGFDAGCDFILNLEEK